MLVGGFFDAHHQRGAAERALFAAMLEEQDVDIMAWATEPPTPPERFEGPMMRGAPGSSTTFRDRPMSDSRCSASSRPTGPLTLAGVPTASCRGCRLTSRARLMGRAKAGVR